MNDEITAVAENEAPPDGNVNGAAPAPPEQAYTEDSVQIYKDTAHIRQRPGMYIGNTSTAGLHHLVYELVYNSVDEALAGHCKTIQVKIHVDGSLEVSDDGRGIPVEEHPEAKRPTLEVVMTTVGAGAKFDKNTYRVSAGLHGIGAKAVTALSEWVEARIRRNGHEYVQEYERGKATTAVTERGTAKRTGTSITFKPDREIFHEATFDYDTLEVRLRELAFLNKGLAIKLVDERPGKQKEELFQYEGGIAEFVQYLNRTEEPLHKPIYIEKAVDNVNVEVALQYTSGEEERVRCYANNAYNSVGGTHLVGFRTALTRTLNNYGTKEEMFKKGLEPIGEDFREGMTAIVSVQVPEPQLEAQTKIRLNNPEVEGIVATVVNEALARYLEETPKDAKKIMNKVILAAEAREAAAKAKKALKDRKSILNSGGLPGKLMDCTTRERDESELFLVEGASAAGSADNGRNRNIQALLPLRGKVLNVEKARVEKVLGNEEICNLISAIGVDINNSEDLSRLRYGKVILLTDADVDGQHIRTLLLTFFFRQMRRLIEQGHVYVARPPLFKVTQKKQVRYIATLGEMARELMDRGLDGTRLSVHPPEALPQAAAVTKKPDPVVFEGDRLRDLVAALDEMEEALQILERRGLSIVAFLQHVKDGKLPTYRVLLGGHEHWFFTPQEVDAFKTEQQQQGHLLVVADEAAPGNGQGNGQATGHVEAFAVQELHEIRTINRGLEKLRSVSLSHDDLVPTPRIAGREPAPRFFLDSADRHMVLPHLRELVAEVRKLGERGLSITRFKGLGEMDGDELWETTLDPDKRTLVKVHLDQASMADDLFRTLMGEKVEPRRDFIHKHALEVKEIDYHGA
ncbi:MAG: DNA gyrase subunit B [Planctomycetes bacterium]|nr:DNA gyrase subunit B [Planctomycetota bacterium]